tara:strand:+ start:563 stop:952 length:390 start_codon:yes stop_codon:yes gene_type:complete
VSINYISNDVKDNENDIELDSQKTQIIHENAKKQKELLESKLHDNIYQKVLFKWSAIDLDETKHDFASVDDIDRNSQKVEFAEGIKERLMSSTNNENWQDATHYVDIEVFKKNNKLAHYLVTKVYDEQS